MTPLPPAGTAEHVRAAAGQRKLVPLAILLAKESETPRAAEEEGPCAKRARLGEGSEQAMAEAALRLERARGRLEAAPILRTLLAGCAAGKSEL